MLVFGAGFGLLGAFWSLDGGAPTAYVTAIWTAFGILIGAVLGGARGRWLDWLYGPPDLPPRR